MALMTIKNNVMLAKIAQGVSLATIISLTIVAFVWGKRDLKTAFELKQRLKEQNITYDCIASDHWQSFDTVFTDANERWVGKQHTQAIEGNHCAIRHRIRRAVRKSCCFSKSLFYHIKVFNIGFAYINACHWRKCQKNRI